MTQDRNSMTNDRNLDSRPTVIIEPDAADTFSIYCRGQNLKGLTWDVMIQKVQALLRPELDAPPKDSPDPKAKVKAIRRFIESLGNAAQKQRATPRLRSTQTPAASTGAQQQTRLKGAKVTMDATDFMKLVAALQKIEKGAAHV